MFDQLSDRLGAIFSRLTGRGKLSESDVNEAMREVRIALLEADVSLAAAKQFVARVKEQAIGQNVLESLTPAQTIVKIVHDELVELLGGAFDTARQAPTRFTFSDAPPSVIMLVGLQGSGKTTQAGKLATFKGAGPPYAARRRRRLSTGRHRAVADARQTSRSSGLRSGYG
jgi:signal recognition particle subunit SRP54